MNIILFIENDTYWFQQVYSQFMLRPEYKIEHYTNLLEAMNRINTASNMLYAIVINVNAIVSNSDISRVLSNIKEKAPFTKIICVLENNDPHLYVSLTQNGAHGVLIKPYSIDALLAEIEKEGYLSGQTQSSFNKQQSTSNYGPQEQRNNFSQNSIYIPHSSQPTGNIQNTDNLKIENLYEMGQGIGQANSPNQAFGFYGQQPYGTQQSFERDFLTNNSQAFYPGSRPPIYTGLQPNRGGIIRIPGNTTIVVHCPKGGVGKTTISKELASVYASSEINGERLKVCLVDMDIDYGDIAIMLDLKQNKSIADWARTIRTRIGNTNETDIWFSYQEIEKFYLLEHKSGLKVLAAPTNHRDAASINDQIARIVIKNLKRYFDVVIIDTGNNVKDFTVVSLEEADHILLVCNLDVATINEILTLRKTLEQIQFPMNKISLLMNEVKKGDEANINQISTFLGIPLIGVIPKIQSVETANNQGTILSIGPDNPFTIGIKKVANTILPVVKKGNAGKSVSGKQKKSIFSSLFKKKN